MADIALPYFTARPAGDRAVPGVVVVHEGNGISSQLLRVCQRLAHQGYAALAPDLYFRAGGTEAQALLPLMRTLTVEQAGADIEEAMGRLRAEGSDAVGVIGFCMGGTFAYRTALSSPTCEAAVAFYGAQIAGELGQPRCPTLLLFGDRDRYISGPDIEAVVVHHPDAVVYGGARHGFMRDGSDDYHEEAATDGWRRMMEFLGRHLGPSPAGRGARVATDAAGD
jgi:carboxymethylenebutenolidase